MHHNSAVLTLSSLTYVPYIIIFNTVLLLTFEFRICVQNHFSLTHSIPLHKKMIKENNLIILAFINLNPSNSFLFLHIYHVNFHYSNRLQGICLLWWWRNPEGRSNCCVGFNVSYTDKGQWVVLWTTMWIRWASWSTCLETGRWAGVGHVFPTDRMRVMGYCLSYQ